MKGFRGSCRPQRAPGFSLLELLVTMAIMGLLILIIVMLQSEMFRFDRTMRINLMTHPEPMSVIARMRRDVLDSTGYPAAAGSYVQSPTSLVLSGLDDRSEAIAIVYDFSDPATAQRLEFDAAGTKRSQWIARGVPRYLIDSYTLPDSRVAVRLQGFDPSGLLTFDQIFTPRRRS